MNINRIPESLCSANEILEAGVEGYLRHLFVASSFNMNQANVMPQVGYLFMRRLMSSGIDIYHVPFLTEFLRKLADVNVHPAGIASPKIAQWAAVNTEHGYFKLF